MSSEPMKEDDDDDMKDDDEKCIECDVCKDNSDDQTTQLPTASKRCIECQENLCSPCLRDHRRQKLLKDHHIVDIPCQVEDNAAESSQSNDKATAHYNAEQILCYKNVSSNVSSGCLPTTHVQHQTSGTDVMAQIKGERDRLKEYEAEMSSHIDRLRKRQEDINTMVDDITKIILKKHLECLARLESDKNSLLKQLDSVKEANISEYGTKLHEAISYLQKITDRRSNLEEIIHKGSVEANDDFTKSLLLHVHFHRPIPTLYKVSFHESFSWTGADNIIGRLEGLTNISKTQTEPTLTNYKNFLRNVHCRTTDAMEINWKLTIPNEVEMKNLFDLKILQGVCNELELSRDDKKWDELLEKQVKLASFLYEMTTPTSELSSKNLEGQLTELQRNIGKLWNTIEFHIHYKNSEKGLIPEEFQNYGNTGYFNSVLQCLLQTVLLPFQLTVNIYGLENVLAEKKEMYCLSKAFLELASIYDESKQRTKALKTLYYEFKEATQRFNDQRQHDSRVLLIHFLDKLRIEERHARKTPSAGPETQKMLTAVDRIFGGQFITVYTCHSCEEPYAIREPFLDISIPLCTLIPAEQKGEENKSKPTTTSEFEKILLDAAKSIFSVNARHDTSNEEIALGTSESQQGQVADFGKYLESYSSCETNLCSLSANDSRKASSTKEVIKNILQPIAVEPEIDHLLYRRIKTPIPNVRQCLKYFTRSEHIKGEYLCRNCQTPGSDELTMTSATKRTLISSPPAILVLHLKRFQQKSNGFVKRDEIISYDELLDLGPFCSCSALRIEPEEENVWYSLYAVVVHSGFFLSEGHYIAYVKQRDSSALLVDQLREKFLQKNSVQRDKVPNDDDLTAMNKRKAVKKREKAKRPSPIPGQWYYIRDDFVSPCDAKEALVQKAFLLFYERISGIDHKFTCV